MAIPVIIGSGAGRRFAWNLSANVGVSSPNQADDVQLVQLGDACAQYGSNFDAATRAIFAAVMPGAPYTGQAKSSCTSIFRALISVPKSRHAPRCHARILPLEDGVKVDYSDARHLGCAVKFNGQRVQYSGGTDGEAVKLTIDTPGRLVGTLRIDDSAVGGAKVDADFDLTLMNTFKSAW